METPHIITTEDGSHTLFSPHFQEIYHSRHGAVAESQHVFLQEGLAPVLAQTPTLQILEIGWGTGLNTFLTWQYLKQFPEKTIFYTALEPFPVPISIIENLNYTENNADKTFFEELHRFSWEIQHHLADNFYFTKHQTTLQLWQSALQFDLIYFDAFAPNKQPEMWEESIFNILFERLNPQGVLVTYCAQGQFRRNLQAAGFAVESRKGPPKKREMTYAKKK